MKRFLLLFLLILLLCGEGWGATVYTKSIDGTVYYESGAASCAAVIAADTAGDLEAALTAAGANGTCYICEGEYSGTELDAADGLDSTADNQTIIGVGNVILDGTGLADHVWANAHAGLIMRDLTIKNSPAGKYNLYIGSTATITDVDLAGGARGFGTYANATFTRVSVYNHADRSDMNAGTLTANYCEYKYNTTYIYVIGGTNHVFTNSNFVGNTDVVLRGYATFNSDCALKNCILAGNQKSGPTSKTILNSSTAGGTFTAYNCLIQPNGRAGDTYGVDAVDGGGNVGLAEANVLPKFVRPRYAVRLAVCVDDLANFAAFQDFAALMEEYGWRCSYALNTAEADAADYAALVPYINKGHEVCSHSVTHPNLAAATAEELTNEVTNSKSAIEAGLLGAGLAYTVNTFVCPYNSTSVAVRAAIKAAGYTGARGLATTADSAAWTLSSLNIYNIYSGSTIDWWGTTNITRNAGAFISWLQEVGGVTCIVLHTPDEHNYTVAQARKMFDVWKKAGVQVMTLGQMIAWAKTYDPSGDLATADDITYTRTMVDVSDYRLGWDSAAIDMGLSVTGVHPTTDYRGRISPWPKGGTPDIGCYEHRHPTVMLPGHGYRRLNQP